MNQEAISSVHFIYVQEVWNELLIFKTDLSMWQSWVVFSNLIAAALQYWNALQLLGTVRSAHSERAPTHCPWEITAALTYLCIWIPDHAPLHKLHNGSVHFQILLSSF